MLYARLEAYPTYRIYINGDVFNECKNGKEIKRRPHLRGKYYRIGFSKDNKQKHFTFHRILAMLFLPCNKNFSDMEVDHINRDPTDNRLCNLRWLDRSGQQLNKSSKGRNSGYPYISRVVGKNNFIYFNCRIQRDGKNVLGTCRAKLEDAVELVAQFIKENRFVLDGLPREKIDKINEIYKIN